MVNTLLIMGLVSGGLILGLLFLWIRGNQPKFLPRKKKMKTKIGELNG